MHRKSLSIIHLVGGIVSTKEPKLSYSASFLRVKVTFARAYAIANPTPPKEIIQRAKAKMESVKQSGQIDSFSIFETRFQQAWTALAADNDLENSQTITITLASGAPDFPGITITKPENQKAVANLTVTSPASKLKEWKYDWFKYAVQKRLREKGVRAYANNSQIHGAFIKARNGERIVKLPIGISPQKVEGEQKMYSVVANKARNEIGVVIRDVKPLRDEEARSAMLKLISQAVKQMQISTPSKNYRPLKTEFMNRLFQAIEGPELMGMDLPMVLLAAIGHTKKIRHSITVPASYPGMGKMNFLISSDKMSAQIVGFDKKIYQDPSFELNLQWIRLELGRAGIAAEISEETQSSLLDKIAQGQSLEGVTIVEGEFGSGGTGPHIYESYKDMESRIEGDFENKDIDLRAMQQRKTVKIGQLVAELRFEKESTPAYNVFGEEVDRPADDELIIRVGDGINQNKPGKFYATCDGIPLIEDNTIALSTALIHAGDVNLRTGNIDFDGPVEIHGSIDSGARVETTGDLIVHGNIRGGYVRCSGSLTVKSGIITGESGVVQARGDINAQFIENSNITCGGDLKVYKAILNCHVICGGSVSTSASDGIIAGGNISCRESLSSSNVGFRNGSLTRMDIGVDWRVQLAVKIREKRFDRLSLEQQDCRQELRELIQKKNSQMTKKHKDLKDELQDRVTRLRIITDKCKEHLEKAERLLSYNSDSKVFVTDLLSNNVDIHVGGNKIAVANEYAGVAILGKRRRGNFIQPIEEVPRVNQTQKAS